MLEKRNSTDKRHHKAHILVLPAVAAAWINRPSTHYRLTLVPSTCHWPIVVNRPTFKYPPSHLRNAPFGGGPRNFHLGLQPRGSVWRTEVPIGSRGEVPIGGLKDEVPQKLKQSADIDYRFWLQKRLKFVKISHNSPPDSWPVCFTVGGAKLPSPCLAPPQPPYGFLYALSVVHYEPWRPWLILLKCTIKHTQMTLAINLLVS